MADDEAGEDIVEYINSLKNVNTHRKTQSDVKIFTKWMRGNGELRELQGIPAPELDKIMARFFMLINKEDGTPYEPTTIKSFQGSISRHLLGMRSINIITDKDFHHSREVLSAKMKELKSMGMGSKKRRAEPFTPEEINTLYEKDLLGAANGLFLIRTVWLNNSLHFGLRSREEHCALRWGDVQMKATSDGLQYLEHTERVTKRRTGANARETRAFQAKMFADPGNVRCPVGIFKQYIKHRPEDMMTDDSPFYLGINRNIKDGIWYSRQPMGKNTLSNFVKDICDKAGIQGRKTNHSARKTTVTALVHQEILDTRIMQLSGHKNIQSINNYSTASIKQQHEMSSILSKVGTGMNAESNKRKSVDSNNNNDEIVSMPDEDDAVLLSASQELEEAELNFTLKEISNFENPQTVSNTTPNHTKRSNEMPEIINDSCKRKVVQMFAGATITGNVTIQFPALT